METILNQFPEYQSNQVLTEDALNATSDFLEQQERLTRFGLTKTGIIENLEFKITQSAIVIEVGFGISTDGYFIAHNYKSGPQSYEFVKSYVFDTNPDVHNRMLNELIGVPFRGENIANEDFSKIQFYQLFTGAQNETQTDTIPFRNLPVGNYKVVLYLEIVKVQQEQCSPTSCDTAGAMRTFRVIPLLVIDTDDLLFKPINAEIKLKNRIKLKRLSNLYQLAKNREWNQKYAIITAEYARVNYQNTRTLLEKLNEIELHWEFPTSLGEKFESINLKRFRSVIAALELMQQTYIPAVDYRNVPFNYGYVAQQVPKSTIPKATAAFLQYTLALKTHTFKTPIQREHANAKIHFQAYYDFCNDLAQAINELVLNYNAYMNKYYSSYTNRLKRLLVLGRNDRYNYDSYRYYSLDNFANQDFRSAKTIFFKHFNRVLVLISKFQQGFGQLQYKTEIKLIPSRYGNYLLEDCAIPYYYKQDLELESAWVVTPHKGLKTDIYQYRDLNAPYSHFVHNISSYNFIRVEGIIGKLIPATRVIYPWLLDFITVKVDTEKQKANFINVLSKNLFQEANLVVKDTIQYKVKEDISLSAISTMKDQLTYEMVKNYSHLGTAVVNELVDKITVDLKHKLSVANQVTSSNLSLSELDKQIDFFNIPLRYEIYNLDNQHDAKLLKYLEPTSGTKVGNTLVLLTKKENAGERVVACFMKYF